MKAMKSALLLLGAVALLGSISAAQHPLNRKTIVTFNQPVKVPGTVLPTGTYVFTLLDSRASRNIVQIFNQDQSQVVATILALHNYRLKPTGETVITFEERPSGTPQAVKAWFYPGLTHGIEFVYPEQEAMAIAQAANEPVPAETEAATTAEQMENVPLVAVTPEQKEEPVEQAMAVEPPAQEAQAEPAAEQNPEAQQAMNEPQQQLPKTGSTLPLVALLGGLSLLAGLALLRFATHSSKS